MKIIYVTGCLGFIGAYVVRRALKKGWQVYGVDKVTYAADLQLLEEFKSYSNFRFEKADIVEMDHLYDCDYIVNCAAESHVDNSIEDSESFMRSNCLGVQNLLRLIKGKVKNSKRPILFHFSTDEVYGDIASGSHVETDVLKPSNPYSASKAAADLLIGAWHRTYDLEYVIIRPTNNYGIGQYPEKLIPLSVKNFERGNKMHLHNNGTPIRTWLHADDTAAATIHLIELGVINETYNISGGFEQQNIETVKKILFCYLQDNPDMHLYEAWQLPRKTFNSYVNMEYSRPGQDVRYSLNDSKLRQTGWSPVRQFDSEIVEIVRYYKDRFIW